ncbi:uncharacterized protein LOC120697565 isoform X2 [Panicum virgatum]|uniref:Uncharacterized protein n=1 Tax=Panicum virgatum TaxID=38727 RepID=A0A8T0ULG0_PANVG|nr:uncharacterized protein LOC120697565 isoform X2 [Panicum virgatum]KAG2624921.1 hypothetical protein PVAP13_3KG156600 [Panicum virgatum]
MTSRSVASTAVASTSPHLCLHGRHYFHAVVVSVSVATGTSPPNCGSASIYTGGLFTRLKPVASILYADDRVFYHQAEQSKDRVTNKDPILSDWILLCDGLCYCHLLICIKVVCQEMQLLLSACTSQK